MKPVSSGHPNLSKRNHTWAEHLASRFVCECTWYAIVCFLAWECFGGVRPGRGPGGGPALQTRGSLPGKEKGATQSQVKHQAQVRGSENTLGGTEAQQQRVWASGPLPRQGRCQPVLRNGKAHSGGRDRGLSRAGKGLEQNS